VVTIDGVQCNYGVDLEIPHPLKLFDITEVTTSRGESITFLTIDKIIRMEQSIKLLLPKLQIHAY
ncbi:hypothetical protein HAX54_014949, partial [Datura stramonium]|nr:hypothetical protein [Datura stramonium]